MTNQSHHTRFAACALTMLALVACGPSDKAGRIPLDGSASAPTPAMTVAQSTTSASEPAEAPSLPHAAVAALEAANIAYRAKKFDVALLKYREASTIAPDHAAPWFGLYMVANELKNPTLADSAMRHVKALSSDPTALGAHAQVTSEAAGGVLPSGHPATKTVLPGHPQTQALPSGHPAPAVKPTTKPTAPLKRGDAQ